MSKQMKIMCSLLLLLLWPVVFLSGQEERASGLFETNFSGVIGSGARALGMGGAFIAIADDATAASWNPGGLGQLETPEFSLGMRYQEYRKISPANGDGINFRGSIDLNTQFVDIDFIAFTYPIRVGNFKIVPQISYQRGISFNFNNNINSVGYLEKGWLPGGAGGTSEVGSITSTQKIKGGVDFYSLSIGSSLFKHVNVGVSVNFWTKGYYADTSEEKSGFLSFDNDPSTRFAVFQRSAERLNLDFKGVNFTLGLLVDLSEKLKMGAVYKNAFNVNMKYSLAKDHFASFAGEVFLDETPQKKGDATLLWPETIGFGISYRPVDPLTISADFTHTSWNDSVFHRFPNYVSETYDTPAYWSEVDLYFPTMTLKDSGGFKQLETRQLRFGTEYVLIGSQTLIPLRLGFFADSQYFPDTSGKSITFFGITGGLGIKWNSLSTDLAVLYEIGSYLRNTYDYSETRVAEFRVYLSTSYSF